MDCTRHNLFGLRQNSGPFFVFNFIFNFKFYFIFFFLGNSNALFPSYTNVNASLSKTKPRDYELYTRRFP